MKKLLWALCAVASISVSSTAYSADCPKISGYTDRNCDGAFTLVFLGDSLVFGIGDSKNRNKGGYVLRTARKLRFAKVHNFGSPGATAEGLLSVIDAAFSSQPTKKQQAIADALLAADFVLVDAGRNDYYTNDRTRTPEETVSTLMAINSEIKEEVTEAGGTAPYVAQAVLMRPNRTDQGIFVKALNGLIQRKHSASFPAELRFDLLSKRLYQKDQIHPNPKGYDSLAATFLQYLSKRVASKL